MKSKTYRNKDEERRKVGKSKRRCIAELEEDIAKPAIVRWCQKFQKERLLEQNYRGSRGTWKGVKWKNKVSFSHFTEGTKFFLDFLTEAQNSHLKTSLGANENEVFGSIKYSI